MRNHSIKTPAKATSKAVTVYKPKRDGDAIKIGKLYQLARASLLDCQKYYIQCGQQLATKKAKLARGEWLPWLKENADALGFDTRQTAHLLMKAAANDKLALHLNETNAVTVSRSVWGHDKPRGTLGTGNNEWNTPEEYIVAARDVLGIIDLDPASNVVAQRVVKASRYYTQETDGLSKQWHGKVWMNPPYSQPEIADFVNKLCEEHEAGRVTEAIMLTNNFSDTQWFHQAVKIAPVFCLTEGRISFIDTKGNRSSPTQGQVFFYFGNRPQVFTARFSEFGFIATAYSSWDMQ